MTDQEIKETFDNIHIPPALLGKVEDAMNTKNFERKKIIKIAAAAIAAFAICLLASNGICYAATGNSLLGKITMYVNGEKIEFENVGIEYGEPISTYTYTTGDTVEDDDIGDCYYITIEPNTKDVSIKESKSDENKQTSSQTKSSNFNVQKEGERVYLVSEDKKKKIDITDDFTGKKAEGNFNWKDVTYHYKVTKKGEEYSLSINAKKK